MAYDKIIEEMKKFKKRLESESDFTDEEKRNLFKAVAESVLQQEEITTKKKPTTQSPYPKENQTTLESFTSLINKTKINQHNDYILGAVYYLIVKEGYGLVNVKDINEQYKKAYLKTTNTNVYVVNLAKKGFLMPDGKKEGTTAFKITREGIKYIEELIQNGE